MSTPYVGEIRMVGFNFAPVGWAFCDGQLMAIAQNDVLFTLIGTTYGGDGQNTFALPNLAGRLPVHQGQGPGLSNYVIGQMAGSESITLTTNQIPAHTHLPAANNTVGSQSTPQNGFWAASPAARYASPPATIPMRSGLVGSSGGGQPHQNLMPFVTINFIISLFGVFPSQI